MADKQITGLHMTGWERLTASAAGNPRFSVTFTDRDRERHVYETHSNASCNWDVENIEGEHRQHLRATVTVWLDRDNRITDMRREG